MSRSVTLTNFGYSYSCVDTHIATSVIVRMPCEGLLPVQLSLLIDQFNVGKDYVLTELSLRVSGWQKLPLKALCIGHHVFENAIEGLLDCLAQYEHIESQVGQVIHGFTWALFARDGPCRAMVLALVQRQATFDELPVLKRFRDIAQFLPVMEISVERKHALVSNAIRDAPNHTTAFVSVRSLRSTDLDEVLNDTSEAVSEFAETVGNHCRSALQCVLTLGIEAHPAFQEHVDENSGKLSYRVPHTSVIDVVYRCDAQTQYRDFADFVDPPPGPPSSGPYFRLGQPGGDHGNGEGGQPPPPGPAGGVGGPSAEADGFLSAFPDDDALEEALFGPSPVRDELDDLLEFRGAAVPPCAPAAPPDTPPRAPAASGLPSGLPPSLPEPSEVAAASQMSDEMTLTALAASVRASAVADTHMSVAVAEIAVADSAMAVTDIVVYHSAVADTDIVAVDSALAEKAIVQLAR
jgi:hypothetical protein